MTLLAKNSPKERDNALLVAVGAGDRRALEELYLSYHRRLARLIQPRARPRIDARQPLFKRQARAHFQTTLQQRGLRSGAFIGVHSSKSPNF